jgi:putative spermidine/putrescine transport system permease protein
MRAQLVSVALIAPLMLFIGLAFVLPLASMFFYAVNNPEVRAALPRTVTELHNWTAGEPVPEAAYPSLAADLVESADGSRLAEAGRRLNYEIAGFRSLLLKTGRQVRAAGAGTHWQRAEIERIDARWAEPSTWHAIRRAGSAYTAYYLLAALDLRQTDSGSIALAAPEDRLFQATLGRTIWIGFVVTVICLLIGYPLANAIVSLPRRFSGVLLACVLLPFWTSLLVRTSAWIVILQREGLVNGALQAIGLTDAPLELVFNRLGLYIAMVHILLPFMVLPLVSVMKGISPSFMRASASLGATPLTGFWRIYLPLTLPGVGAGCLLTFIIAAGYYITPTLVGGAGDQMLSYFVAFFANTTINWGMSAALGLVLLTCILALYVAMGRVIGISRIAGLG